jgi:glutamyl-tRNA synthetase
MLKTVRVRFAPSPTGNMHIGGLRTALFNWLFARHTGGTFLVRIEDTDRERSEEKYVRALLDALLWVGIESDEKPLFQSQRQDSYHAVLNQLLESGRAYRCFCTAEEVEVRVKAAGITDEFYHYDGFCRKLPIVEGETRPYGIRFALPEDIERIEVTDLIRGHVVFERNQLDDFIIFRSDGTPMYNFAVVVDDNYSGITHIIRGEEHLSNTPKQILLYQACGFAVPTFAHLPMILAPDGTKLSKRHGAVDVLSYRNEGYLPDALINYIVRLGWAHGDQEIFTRSEMIASFSIEGVGKKAAIFDHQKLAWMNGVYLRDLSPRAVQEAISFTDAALFFSNLRKNLSPETVLEAIRLYQPRVKTLVELVQEIQTLFEGPSTYNSEDVAKWTTPGKTVGLLSTVLKILEPCEPFDAHTIGALLKELSEQEGLKLVSFAQPLRIALTGGASSPGVFELLALLQKEKSLARIRAFTRFLAQ